MTPKLYCLLPSCIWRTADNVCGWTVCPYGKRVLARPIPPPEPTSELPNPKPKGRSKPIIGTDSTGKEYHYPSAAAATRAHGVSRNAISSAAYEGHRAAGMYWRWDI